MESCGNFIGPYPCCSIITGDARELAKVIPDESIDLIFTDPVYDRIEDYRWLAEIGQAVLKPDASLLVWGTIANQYDVQRVVSSVIPWRWTFTTIIHGQANRLMGYHLFTKTTPLLWFSKQLVYPNHWIMDTISQATGNSRFDLPKIHGWQKMPEFIAYFLNALCPSAGSVWDAFCGGGTVPAVCKMLGRHYLAFEIEPDVAEKARGRVRNTQVPLFVMEPEQAALL